MMKLTILFLLLITITITACSSSSPELPVNSTPPITENTPKPSVTNMTLPTQVSRKILEDIAQKNDISTETLKITEFSPQTWPDGCLGLAKADEFCSQMLIEGWRVVVSDNQEKTWIYRTDSQGINLRLEILN